MTLDRRPLRAAALLAMVLMTAGTLAGAARGDSALYAADVVRFLTAGISEHTILLELEGRGFAEPLNDAREAMLREAGASETLIVAIRRVAPGAKPEAAGPSTAATAAATAPLPPATGRTPIFSSEASRTVRVPVTVVDQDGRPVLDLRSEDFTVADDGKRQPVSLFSGERRPLRIALALDISRSMKDKIREVDEALKHFIDLLEPSDEIMVITFNNAVHVAQDFTSDRNLLGDVLDRLEPDGATTLFDAAYLAIKRVSAGPAESKAVVLVTDGVDSASETSFIELRELARRSEVPVYSIGLDSDGGLQHVMQRHHGRGGFGGFGGHGGGGRGGFPGNGGFGGGFGGGDEQRFNAKPLVELADETGARAEIVKGAAHYAPGAETPTNDKLKDAVESIATTLRHRYLIGYEAPRDGHGWRSIRVTVDKPATTARARKGYYAS